jgi:predicted nuclease of predicted toxin-antitoxin system
MRFLVDNPVSPLLAEALRRGGHDAVHVLDYGLQAASDAIIFERASKENRIIVTGDTDFGLLAARTGIRKPSIILFHHSFPHRPSEQAKILVRNLARLATALEEGSLVVLESRRIRIRSLPIIS